MYTAEIAWTLAEGEDFRAGRYSRGHQLRFDGGTQVPGSASPHIVGRWAVESAVDPEEMLVAALSACHMLFVCTSHARRASASQPIGIVPKARWRRSRRAARR